MKIIHVVYSCIPEQFRGGVPKVAYELSRAQAQLGHKVTVFSTNYNSSLAVDVPFNQAVIADGVEIRYFPVQQPRWFSSPRLRQELLATSIHYDILHSHNTFLALNKYAAEAQSLSGRPLFYHVHGALDPIVVRKGLAKRLRKMLYIRLVERQNLSQATGLFALSSREAEQIRSYGINSPIHVVPNGICVNRDHPDRPSQEGACNFRTKFRLGASQDIILFLGRVVPKKGLHLLIPAFAHIRQSSPNVVLVIAGDRAQDPAYVRKLDKLINETGIAESVIWTGFLNEIDKRQALAAATIFSHVSESEGMAIAVLEAMASGLPVIVSRECYMKDAVHSGAVIESEFQVDSLAAKLELLLINVEHRKETGRNAFQYIRRYHSWANLAQQIVEVYESAL
jgi:glycosyltransferase involved in cell wall biosynthesis